MGCPWWRAWWCLRPAAKAEGASNRTSRSARNEKRFMMSRLPRMPGVRAGRRQRFSNSRHQNLQLPPPWHCMQQQRVCGRAIGGGRGFCGAPVGRGGGVVTFWALQAIAVGPIDLKSDSAFGNFSVTIMRKRERDEHSKPSSRWSESMKVCIQLSLFTEH